MTLKDFAESVNPITANYTVPTDTVTIISDNVKKNGIGYANTGNNFYVYDIDNDGMTVPKIQIPINDNTRNLIRYITSGKALSRADVDLAKSIGLSRLGLNTVSSLLSGFPEGTRGNNTYASLGKRMYSGQEDVGGETNLSNIDEQSNSDSEEYRRESLRITYEINAIVTNAKKSHTLFKTPNGERSNLNERQWLQVRTQAFKKWFGDWINDPANASKMVQISLL